jgi:phosphate transport system substrate-binding protein
LLARTSRLGATILIGAVLAACGSTGGATNTPPASAAAPSSGTASSGGPASCVGGSITASGSTALQPLVDAAAKDYVKDCPDAQIQVQGGGSGTGLSQVSQGAVDIGDSDVTAESKLQPADAAALVDHVVAKQGWVMVISEDVTGVTNLSTQQAKDIWTGAITNWKDVGGPDEPIVLILRPASSGTRATFKKIVLGGADEAAGQALTEDSNGAVTSAVSGTPGATSVIGFAYYQSNLGKVLPLQLDGVDATVQNMTAGTYKLSADGHMYTKGTPTGLTAAFLDYMLGPVVQGTTIPGLFYAPVK